MTSPVLTIWVIYYGPLDHPGKYVVRGHNVIRGQPEPVPHKLALTCDTLEQARRLLPPDLHRIDRHPCDEPEIVETWV